MTREPNQRREARQIMRDMLRWLPNFVKLLFRLLKDKRVPLAEKALLLGTITYVISPLDFIPDVIPFVGQVDDLYLIALVVLRLLSRTSNAVLIDHWEGPGDIVNVVDKIATAAQYVLPTRVRQILLGRVVIAPQVKGGIASSPAVPQPIDLEREKRARRPTASGE